jgi:hypothetical protein
MERPRQTRESLDELYPVYAAQVIVQASQTHSGNIYGPICTVCGSNETLLLY